MRKIDISLNHNFGIIRERNGRLNGQLIVLALQSAWSGLGLGNIGLAVGTTLTTLGQVVASVINIGISIGLSIWSGSAGKHSTPINSLDVNGQLINTRQASEPIRIIYGIVKTGGTWVYSKATSWNNNNLNTVVVWSEGEIEGIHTAIDSDALFTGTGINDLGTEGEFAYSGCTCDASCHDYGACSCNMTCHSTYS